MNSRLTWSVVTYCAFEGLHAHNHYHCFCVAATASTWPGSALFSLPAEVGSFELNTRLLFAVLPPGYSSCALSSCLTAAPGSLPSKRSLQPSQINLVPSPTATPCMTPVALVKQPSTFLHGRELREVWGWDFGGMKTTGVFGIFCVLKARSWRFWSSH